MTMTMSPDDRRAYIARRQQEMLEYVRRKRITNAKIKAFADARGWKHKRWRGAGVGKLVPGHRNDAGLRVPHEDHVENFYALSPSGKWQPVAYVSQPYGQNGDTPAITTTRLEMQHWAARWGLQVEFPDEPAFHNDQCRLNVFTLDPNSQLAKAAHRLGERWVSQYICTGDQLIEPERHAEFVEPCKRALTDQQAKKPRRRVLLYGGKDAPTYVVQIYAGPCRLPVDRLDEQSICAVIRRNL